MARPPYRRPYRDGRSRKAGGGGTRFLAVLLAAALMAGAFWLLPRLSGRGEGGPSSAAPSASGSSGGLSALESSEAPDGEYRAVWFSYLDLADILTGKGETEFAESINDEFQNCAEMGLNTVIVQVRPYSDALYPSKLFPYSKYAAGKQGQDPGFDPLKIMVEAAHQKGLKIEAWINPYRISSAADSAPCAENPGAKWFADSATKGDWVVQVGEGLYYNPAIPQVQDLIVSGVEEILQNYAVDGIHFDDYFYPSGADDSFDAAAYRRYRDGGGQLSLGDFRRANVDALVQRVYQAVKAKNPALVFGISPQGNVDNCYRSMYADVKKWASQPGYVDYIAPQIYWGYSHPQASARYDVKISEWNSYCKEPSVKLYIGLAAYRMGDEATGFSQNGDDMARMVADARKKSAYRGFILFRYQNLTDGGEVAQKEVGNLKALLKK